MCTGPLHPVRREVQLVRYSQDRPSRPTSERSAIQRNATVLCGTALVVNWQPHIGIHAALIPVDGVCRWESEATVMEAGSRRSVVIVRLLIGAIDVWKLAWPQLNHAEEQIENLITALKPSEMYDCLIVSRPAIPLHIRPHQPQLGALVCYLAGCHLFLVVDAETVSMRRKARFGTYRCCLVCTDRPHSSADSYMPYAGQHARSHLPPPPYPSLPPRRVFVSRAQDVAQYEPDPASSLFRAWNRG